MVDVTANQAGTNINPHGPYAGLGIMDEAAELLLDDEIMMDPLFEEDWLHENNLDILFDLFEEEIESKIAGDSNDNSPTTTTTTLFGTSPVTLFGTSPVTLFGTSPSSASALDLIYFENQKPTTTAERELVKVECKTHDKLHRTIENTTTTTTNVTATPAKQTSTTYAMRIKRGLKKGQSEGVSLLAKPGLSNSASSKTTARNSNSTSNKISDKINSSRKMNSLPSNKNISVKITNFKNSIIIGNATTNNVINRNGIDINYSKQSQQQNRERYYLHKCQQHVHYITGRAVIREHAYAVSRSPKF